jgi:hypothetical protein
MNLNLLSLVIITNEGIIALISSYYLSLRDRPFNLKGGGVMVFCFVSEFFFRTTRELEYLFFLLRKAGIFLPEFNIGLYMTKTQNQIIFFFLHQNQNIFFSNIGNQNIFLEKNRNTPLQVKWSFPYCI